MLTLGMSIFLGHDLVSPNDPDRAAISMANAPTQVFVDTLKGLRMAGGGSLTHTNAAVGASFDHEVVGQFASAPGKPFDLVFLGLGMNSGSLYGVHGRGPNASFTKGVLKTFLGELKASGATPIVCNTIHPWPDKFDPAAENGSLADGIAYPPDRSTLYSYVDLTLDAKNQTLSVGTIDGPNVRFFDAGGPGAQIAIGSKLLIRSGAGANDGRLIVVVAKIDAFTLQLRTDDIVASGSFRAFVQHVSPDTEHILEIPPSKQRQLRDWTGSGVQVSGLASFALWNSILRQLCEEEQVTLLDFEYRGFRWVEQHGWDSVYTSTYGGVEFKTYNHPQLAAQKVVYGDAMRALAQKFYAGDLRAGFELIRGPTIS